MQISSIISPKNLNQFDSAKKPIDPVARIFLSYKNFSSSNNTVSIVEFTGNLDLLILRKAIDILQQRHTMLAVRIENENHVHFSTENVPEIPVSTVERFNDRHWRDIAFDELHRPLPLYTGPLMRVIHCVGQQRSELILILDHIIADGTSRVHLSIELFEIIHALRKNEPIPIQSDNSWQTTHKNLLTGITQKEYDDLSDLDENFGNKKSFSNVPPIVFSRRTHFIPHDFSSKETAYIQEKYRSCKSSLQGILSAAVAQVIAEQVREKTGDASPSIICHHPINLRPYSTPQLKPSDVGVYVGIIDDTVTVDPDGDLCALSYRIRTKLHAGLQSKRHLKLFYDLNKGPKSERSDHEVFMSVQSCHPTAVVSQLGTIPVADQYGDLRVEAIRGLYNWSIMLNHPDTFIVTGLKLREQLQIMFVYVYPYVDHEKAIYMSNRVIEKLLE